jgi:hypothetical protein
MNGLACAALAVAIVVSHVSGASAQTKQAPPVPDLRGIWSGVSQVIIDGSTANHPASASAHAASRFRLREAEFTYRIEGQDGVRFWGTITSTYRVERVIGAIAADGKHVYMVSQDGFVDGVLSDKDTIDTCFRQLRPDAAAAACNTIRRKR